MSRKIAEQKIGIVPRGTIVQLAKSMCRAKIVECESDIRRAKYGRELETFKPSDAPASVQSDARKVARLRSEVKRIEKRLNDKGFEVGYGETLKPSYSVTRAAASAARERRYARLAAARELREATLIALIGAAGAKDAADILKSLRMKLGAI